MITIVATFDYGANRHVIYRADKAGDELAMHEHCDTGHLTVAMYGDIEAFFPDHIPVAAQPGDAPFEFGTYRLHGIRAKTDGAMFMSVSLLLQR
jgi:hypothetical protein